MKLYISGPMTGITDFNFPLFDAVRDDLIRQGHSVWSPADHDREVITRLWPGKRPEDFPGYAAGNIHEYFDAVSHGGEFVLDNMMAWDLNVIVNEVDGIVLLPGWQRSSGGLSELYAAESVSKQVYYAEWNGDTWIILLAPLQQYLRTTLREAVNA